MSKINVQQLLDMECTIVDVRSESEYEQSHIPGAVNIPILEDKQRESVGTIYKNFGRDDAIEEGIKSVQGKLDDLYLRFKTITNKGNVVIYCARGGMRSNSVYSFLVSFGLENIFLLDGGYKSYRNHILENFKDLYEGIHLITLHGHTGTGKTIILRELEKHGCGVVDLEYLARNAGSVFGTVPYNEKMPTQKQFENDLFHCLLKVGNVAFIESESKRIGNIMLDNDFHDYIYRSEHVLVETSLENRIENVYEDYMKYKNDEKLVSALNKLRKRLSNETVDVMIKQVTASEYRTVIKDLIEKYYDALYQYSIDKFEPYDEYLSYETIEEITNKLLVTYETAKSRLEGTKNEIENNKVYIETLGCNKNQVDSEIMSGLLSSKGYKIVSIPEQAQIIIINTCSFIESAKIESLDTTFELLELKRAGIARHILMTGCLSQRYSGELLDEIPDVDAFIGTGNFHKIVETLDKVKLGERVVLVDNINEVFPETLPRTLSTPKHYAFLKIAEGCDNNCTYCIIPQLRGEYRSRKIEDVVKEANDLVKSGAKELILIAQDTTRYGIDLYGKYSLADLLDELQKIEGLKWVRIQYAYPDVIDDNLIDAIRRNDKVVKYLDIPLQHISDRVLKRMNRHTSSDDIKMLLEKLRREIKRKEEQIKELATIPAREVLIAKLLGSLKAPVSNFAYLVKAIAEKKEAEGA